MKYLIQEKIILSTHDYYMTMGTNNTTARIAGLLYLLLSITGAFSILYIPSRFIVWADAQSTINNILQAEALFRLGIVSGLITNILFLLLPFVLYMLLRQVNKTMAILMVMFAVISVPVTLVVLGNLFDVLALVADENYAGLSATEWIETQVMASLYSYQHGTFVATFFWGLWLFPFGYLVFKSGILPKFFGVFLIAGCFGYLIDFLGLSLWPDSYNETLIPTFIHIPSAIGEIGICFWLLIRGVKEHSTDL